MRVAPVAHSGSCSACWWWCASADECFSEEDERVLAELARQVGLALHNVRLDSALQASLDELRHKAEELQASRARIVAAADAERRRIERNLHDGAQQRLVALAVKLGLARRLVDADPDQTRGMLDELRDELKDAVEELRNLAHGIYPPLLMDQGLAAALGSAAQRATIPTRVEAGPLGRYPGRGRGRRLLLLPGGAPERDEARRPEATVAGAGLGGGGRPPLRGDRRRRRPRPDRQGHRHRLRQHGDRLGAIGGSLRVESTPGAGTSVLGVLPLAGQRI